MAEILVPSRTSIPQSPPLADIAHAARSDALAARRILRLAEFHLRPFSAGDRLLVAALRRHADAVAARSQDLTVTTASIVTAIALAEAGIAP